MPDLSYRRNFDAPAECWHVFYRDVRVGTIALCTEIPHHADHPWDWNCRFYPCSQLKEPMSGTAANFGQARAELEKAWRVILRAKTGFHQLPAILTLELALLGVLLDRLPSPNARAPKAANDNGRSWCFLPFPGGWYAAC